MLLRSLLWTTIYLLVSTCTSEEYLDLNLPEGFRAELVYSPSEHHQGSWVCLTTDHQGRLIASDQYGKLYRITPGQKGKGLIEIDSITLNIGRAQGLLWAFNSLYVSVNNFDTEAGPESGVYRLTDSDGDDQLDHVEQLVSLDGAGEHGPHSLVLGPDQQIYLIAGNHTDIPTSFSSFQVPVWKEDRLMPAVKDPRGHANERGAPGGWIARTDSLGQHWEVIANGFRNAYDMAFAKGDLFTYDSDMEWDLGTPWYRPTRICHVIPGAEYGWRTGSAKWPDYYPDNLPGLMPMGQGSPTGVVYGANSNFPAKYQDGLFVLDWSFGTIYFIGLDPQGASFKGKKEMFLAGSPLPVTDAVFGQDGSLYFTTGGRRSASGLYRVSYQGKPVAATKTPPPSLEAQLRRQLEKMSDGDPKHLEKIWDLLDHEDRYVRYAARIALERQHPQSWKERIADASSDARIQSCLALIRTAEETNKSLVSDALSSLNGSNLDHRQQLDLMRAYSLLFSRWGPSESAVLSNLPEYPTGDPALDRELCDLLSYLEHPEVVAKTIPLMEVAQGTLEAELIDQSTLERSEQYGPVIAAMRENRPLEQSMAYALSLTQTREGWTDDLRARYFKWFYQSLVKSGGESYKGFLEKIRLKALDQVPAEERGVLAQLSGEVLLDQPITISAQVDPPKGPGRVWEVGEANTLISEHLKNRSFTHGQQMYQALLCGSCHSMQGQGGNVGPDLTQTGTRFSAWDMLQSLQTPSLAISDQYAGTLFTLKDGSTLVGRTLHTTDDSLFVNSNPYQPTTTLALAKSQVASQQNSPVSLMPAGLINSLNEEELLDLMAYLKSGGNPHHEVFD